MVLQRPQKNPLLKTYLATPLQCSNARCLVGLSGMVVRGVGRILRKGGGLTPGRKCRRHYGQGSGDRPGSGGH